MLTILSDVVNLVNVSNFINAMDWIETVCTTLTLDRMPTKPLPESEKKVTIGVRLSPRGAMRLSEIARDDDRTVSYLAAKILEAWIVEHDKPRRLPKASR